MHFIKTFRNDCILTFTYKRAIVLVISILCISFICTYFIQKANLTSYMKSMEYGQRRGSFGLITDIQYANCADGYNFPQTRARYFRNSLVQLQTAVDSWRTRGVEFAVNLGDAIDGRCKRTNDSEFCLSDVLREFQKLNKPVFHIFGNHDFYNFNRKTLINVEGFYSANAENVSTGKPDSLYYHFEAFPGFRIVAVDSFAQATLGYSKESDEYKQAHSMLRRVNSNSDLNSAAGMPLNEVRFVEFNGALGEEQRDWLDQVLENADQQGEHVLILTHVPFYHEATDYYCVCWDAEQILETINKHPSVFAVFGGHDHDGGYAVDIAGVNHVTFEGVVETEPSSTAFAIVHVREHGLEIEGFGRVPSRLLPFRNVEKPLNISSR